MDTSIFKAYDIRGLYPSQINKDIAQRIGRAFGVFVKNFYKIEEPRIIVGYDIRNSSKELFEAMSQSLLQEGCRVINIGLCSTPFNYFANWYIKADASVMITASHNPKDYNGFKFSLRGVVALAEVDGIERIKELVTNESIFFAPLPASRPGKLEEQDFIPDFLDFLTKEAGDTDFSKLKIAADCSNGMVGPIFEKLAKRIGLNYKGLFMEMDGDFPNHEPNPLNKEAIRGLQSLMKKERFDLGVIFDGDGDRFMVLSSEGKLMRSDFLLAIFAQHFLPRIENKKIPCDARTGRGVKEAIWNAGGEMIKSKVGYPYIKKIMRKEKAFLGAELSGHFFWQDFSYSESVLLSMIRLFGILRERKEPIENLVKPMDKYFNSGEINFKTEDKEGALKKIEEKFNDGEISKLDGLTIEYQGWWFNVRASNTEPLLRLIVETKTEELLKKKVGELEGLIKEN